MGCRRCDIVVDVHGSTGDKLMTCTSISYSVCEKLEHVYYQFPKYYMKCLEISVPK
jgi:hypothetical protein